MKVIYKYELRPPADDDSAPWTSKVILPVNAQVLVARNQDDKLYVWCLVDRHPMSTETVIFHVIPTGFQEIDDDLMTLQYISTVFFQDGKYVFHVFREFIQ